MPRSPSACRILDPLTLLLGRIRRLLGVDVRPEYPRNACAQCLAVRQHNLHDAPDGLAILDGLQRHRNMIARLEDLFAPTEVGHVRWIAGFRDPMDDGALVVRR